MTDKEFLKKMQELEIPKEWYNINEEKNPTNYVVKKYRDNFAFLFLEDGKMVDLKIFKLKKEALDHLCESILLDLNQIMESEYLLRKHM